MKKRIFIGSVLVVFVVMILVSHCTKNEVVVVKESNENKNNLISLMIETGIDTNKYNASTTSEWPGIYYEINKEKSGCENGGTLIYNKNEQKISMKNNVSDKCYVYFDRVTLNFVSHIKSLYTGKGDNNIYYHNASLVGSAQDNSYRYSGTTSDVNNNYVCFGSTATTCPDDNLYRIIGVIDGSVRLYKNISIGNGQTKMAWDSNGNRVWSTSTLNTYLNSTFLTGLGTWANYIKTTTWYSGEYTFVDVDYEKALYAKDFYDMERATTTSSAKIGLLYASDYGFSAHPQYYTGTKIYDGPSYYFNYDVWMGTTEYHQWMLNPVTYQEDIYTDEEYGALMLSSGSTTFSKKPHLSQVSRTTPAYLVNPVFNLETNTEIKDGDGTKTNPYRLK